MGRKSRNKLTEGEVANQSRGGGGEFKRREGTSMARRREGLLTYPSSWGKPLYKTASC